MLLSSSVYPGPASSTPAVAHKWRKHNSTGSAVVSLPLVRSGWLPCSVSCKTSRVLFAASIISFYALRDLQHAPPRTTVALVMSYNCCILATPIVTLEIVCCKCYFSRMCGSCNCWTGFWSFQLIKWLPLGAHTIPVKLIWWLFLSKEQRQWLFVKT